MSVYSILLFVGICIFIPVLLFLYLLLPLLARKAYKGYLDDHTDYRKKLSRTRRRRKYTKERIEWKWPIWPRPLLFDDIDHSTQMALARAEQAWKEIENIELAIKPITSPSAGIYALADIKRNIDIINLTRTNHRLFKEFYKLQDIIDTSWKVVNSNDKKVASELNRVKQRVDNLIRELANTGPNVTFIKRLGSVRHEDVSKHIHTCEDCIGYAELEISKASREDLIEWVVSDLLCKAGEISLSIFNLKAQSYRYPENFELNEVTSKLSNLTYNLDVLLNYKNEYEWRHLVKWSNELHKYDVELHNIGLSLEVFERKHQEFQDLFRKIRVLNLYTLIKDALDTEGKLLIYVSEEKVRAYTSGLGLPSHQLKAKQDEYEKQIQPLIEGTIIRQSDLPFIIDMMQEFFRDIHRIQRLVIRLNKICQEQLKCEIETRQRLGPNGESTNLIERLEKFSNDSTHEIMAECHEKFDTYSRYKDGVDGKKLRVDYLDLLPGIKKFEEECRDLEKKHLAAISALQSEALTSYRRITISRKDFLDRKARLPYIEFDWNTLFNNFDQIEKEYRGAEDSYGLLEAFIKHAKKFLRNNKADLDRIDREYKQYDSKTVKIGKERRELENLINKKLKQLQEGWNLPLSKHIRNLYGYQQQLNQVQDQLNATKSNISISKAISICDDVDLKIKSLGRSLQNVIAMADHDKQKLDQNMAQVEELLNTRKKKNLNQGAISDAIRYKTKAMDANDYEEAKEYLDKAKGILENENLFSPSVPQTQIVNERPTYTLFNLPKNVWVKNQQGGQLNAFPKKAIQNIRNITRRKRR